MKDINWGAIFATVILLAYLALMIWGGIALWTTSIPVWAKVLATLLIIV